MLPPKLLPHVAATNLRDYNSQLQTHGLVPHPQEGEQPTPGAITGKDVIEVQAWNLKESIYTDNAKRVLEKTRKARLGSCNCTKTCACEGYCSCVCGDDCLNRACALECGPSNCKQRTCSNRPLTLLRDGLPLAVVVFPTDYAGNGLKAGQNFLPGEIIIEYIGEVKTEDENRDVRFLSPRHDLTDVL